MHPSTKGRSVWPLEQPSPAHHCAVIDAGANAVRWYLRMADAVEDALTVRGADSGPRYVVHVVVSATGEPD